MTIEATELVLKLAALRERLNQAKVEILEVSIKIALDPSDPKTEGELIGAADMVNIAMKNLHRAIENISGSK